MDLVPWLVLIIVLIIILYFIFHKQYDEVRTDGDQSSADGNGGLYYLGRGSEDDDIETLLQRCFWLPYLHKRRSNWQRVFIATLIALILMIVIVWNGLPRLEILIATGIIIFFAVFMFENFMYVHGDIYNDYYTRNNVRILANKLDKDVDWNEDPPKPKSNPPDRTLVM